MSPRYEFFSVYLIKKRKHLYAWTIIRKGIFKLFNKIFFFWPFQKFLIFILYILYTENGTKSTFYLFLLLFCLRNLLFDYIYLNYKSCENVISLLQNIHGFTSNVQYEQKKQIYKHIKTPGECFNLHEIQMGSAFDFAVHI